LFILTVLAVLAAMAVLWQPLKWLFGLAPAVSLLLLLLTAIALILLILIQRGKGGGLSGAFGGLGGQSAFGTKAGDTFTKITVGLAVFWIYLCVVIAGTVTTPKEDRLGLGSGGTNVEQKGEGTGSSNEGSPARKPPGGDSAPAAPTHPPSDKASE